MSDHEIGEGDVVEHVYRPGYLLTVQRVHGCSTGSRSGKAHPAYQLVNEGDPDGELMIICSHDVKLVRSVTPGIYDTLKNVINEVAEAAFGDLRPSKEKPFLRSMLILLGETGRALTYDNDRHIGLRPALRDLAEVAYDWAVSLNSAPVRNLIEAEARRAHEKHGENSMLGAGASDLHRLAGLTEECGEAAEKQLPESRLAEVVQVCSAACSWMAWLDAQVPDVLIHDENCEACRNEKCGCGNQPELCPECGASKYKGQRCPRSLFHEPRVPPVDWGKVMLTVEPDKVLHWVSDDGGPWKPSEESEAEFRRQYLNRRVPGAGGGSGG